MGKIRNPYLKARWFDKLIGAVVLTALTTTFAFTQHFDWLFTGIATAILCVVFHVGITYPRHVATTTVIALHTFLMFVMSLFYGQAIFGTFGYVAAFYAFAMMALVSIIYIFVAAKFSPGRLWLTLLMTFLVLDIGGIVLIEMLKINNMLVPFVASAIVLTARCFLWRNVFSRDKVDYSVFNSDESVLAAKTILENLENTTVSVPDSVKFKNIDLIVETATKNYFIKVVNTKKPIYIHPKGISSNGIFIDGLMLLAAVDAAKANRKKSSREFETAILNMNDASSSKQTVRISPRNAKTRAVEVAVASPAALVKEIKKS